MTLRNLWRGVSWTSQTPTKYTGLFLRVQKKVGLPGLGSQNIGSLTIFSFQALFHSEGLFFFFFFLLYPSFLLPHVQAQETLCPRSQGHKLKFLWYWYRLISQIPTLYLWVYAHACVCMCFSVSSIGVRYGPNFSNKIWKTSSEFYLYLSVFHD